MTTAINLNNNDFPEVLEKLNVLADKMSQSPSTRPSIRKLAADLLLEICQAKLDERKEQDSTPKVVESQEKSYPN